MACSWSEVVYATHATHPPDAINSTDTIYELSAIHATNTLHTSIALDKP
ncbi:hypothetical protein GCM10008022_41440 [Paenibacillus hunanensis]|nr:hypothetical protein GCM10008022_41440 [Paenibacillus hunanensis]